MKIFKLYKLTFVATLVCIIGLQNLHAQNWDTLPYISYADYRLNYLDKNQIGTQILYDRIFPIAEVPQYTGLSPYTNNDTTNPSHFTQAYYELYSAAYEKKGWISPDALDASIKSNGTNTEHPIGLFCYQLNSIDTNALEDHLLDTLSNGQFVDVLDRPRSPYFEHTSFLASPLLAEGQTMEPGEHTFYIDQQFFLTNQDLTITQIRVDFGDGQGEWIVNNPYSSGQLTQRGFGSFIKKVLVGALLVGRIVIVGIDALGRKIVYGNPFKYEIKNTKVYAPLTECKGLQKWVIEAPASRLAPINAQYGNPQLEYKNKDGNEVKDTAYFYFAGNGTTCNTGVLRKPIIFIDGIDPTNDRGVQKIYEDYINKRVERNLDPNTLFGDYMLNEGFDFIILDYKHGNDLLERNAMTVVSLIERLNQTYGSTMTQGITLIGPSMGSLIAQYALAYMEHNNIPHNVRTYISFDGCHQGANVPIGLQNFVEYVTKRGILKNTKIVREGLYNGLGARQLLAHHVSANSNFPAPDALRTMFLQNLAAVGEYPQLCRKVALINGSKTGAINQNHPNPSESLMHIEIKRKIFLGLCNSDICKKVDWEFWTTPNNGNARVTKMWTADPFFNLLLWVPLGRTNYYADAAWGNSSLDNAPGGTFGKIFGDQPGQFVENNIAFLLKEAVFLITGSKNPTAFSQNINNFTIMPSYSAADIRYSSKNLYQRIDQCPPTPFDYIYAPVNNEEHVTVSQEGSVWFENEARGLFPCNTSCLSISGPTAFCDNAIYSITPPTGTTVTWSAYPAIVSFNPTTGAQTTATRISNRSTTITATISNANCSSPVTKNVTVGSFANAYYNVSSNNVASYNNQLYNGGGGSTFLPKNQSVMYGIVVPYSGATNISWNVSGNYNLFYPGSQGASLYMVAPGTAYTSNNATVTLSANGACGPFTETYNFQVVATNNTGGGGGWRMVSSPNPATTNLNVSITPVAEQNVKGPLAKSDAKQNVATKTVLSLYDLYTNVMVKRWIYNDNQSEKYSLNVSDVKRGYYVLKMERESAATTTKVSIQ